MPPEWAPHEACLMAWPSRESLWGPVFDQAKDVYADVARAIAGFEPVVMVCNPGDEAAVRDRCGAAVEPLAIPIDDSWMRDSGPIFVVDDRGTVALVHFRFNSWGEKYLPYDKDAAVPEAIASHLGIRRYRAPFVLEGGSFFVDGEGTLLTTEQCLLNPNRNPTMSREEIETCLREYLGVERVLWLQAFEDRDTDGHVDGIAQYVRPGAIALETPRDPANANFAFAASNLERLAAQPDARGRTLEVHGVEPTAHAEVAGVAVEIPYLNCYLPNGAVVVPTGGVDQDAEALSRMAEIFPDREVVGVPGAVLSYGGGGPHCITQQVPSRVRVLERDRATAESGAAPATPP
jgi:agmatine deiminase